MLVFRWSFSSYIYFSEARRTSTHVLLSASFYVAAVLAFRWPFSLHIFFRSRRRTAPTSKPPKPESRWKRNSQTSQTTIKQYWWVKRTEGAWGLGGGVEREIEARERETQIEGGGEWGEHRKWESLREGAGVWETDKEGGRHRGRKNRGNVWGRDIERGRKR